MAKKIITEEKAPVVTLSKEEAKAVAELETLNDEVIASMEGRNLETEKNEKQIADSRKSLKKRDEIDPVKRRELMRGNKE